MATAVVIEENIIVLVGIGIGSPRTVVPNGRQNKGVAVKRYLK